MFVSIFTTTFVWNTFHSKKNWARYYHKCIRVFTQSTRYSRPILMKLEFSRQSFEKYPNIKIMKILPMGAEVFHVDGQT